LELDYVALWISDVAPSDPCTCRCLKRDNVADCGAARVEYLALGREHVGHDEGDMREAGSIDFGPDGIGKHAIGVDLQGGTVWTEAGETEMHALNCGTLHASAGFEIRPRVVSLGGHRNTAEDLLVERRKGTPVSRDEIGVAVSGVADHGWRLGTFRYEPPSANRCEQIGCRAVSGPGHGIGASVIGAVGPSEVPSQQIAGPPIGDRWYSSWTNLPVLESYT